MFNQIEKNSTIFTKFVMIWLEIDKLEREGGGGWG